MATSWDEGVGTRLPALLSAPPEQLNVYRELFMPHEAVDQAAPSHVVYERLCYDGWLFSCRPDMSDRDLEHGVNPHLLIYSPGPSPAPTTHVPRARCEHRTRHALHPQEVTSYTDHEYL